MFWRYCFLLAILACSSVLTAQREYIALGIGYNSQPAPGINQVISQYNYTRPWLTKEMGEVHFFIPQTFTFGFVENKFGAELRIVRRRLTRIAKGVSPATGVESVREVRVKSNALSFGFTYQIFGGEDPWLVAGFSGDIGAFKVKTRVDDEQWTTVGKGVMGIQPGVTLFALAFAGDVVIIRPYYQFILSRINIQSFQAQMNPGSMNSGVGGTDFNSAHFTFDERVNNFGLEIAINLFYP
jgi:hypothetical protein